MTDDDAKLDEWIQRWASWIKWNAGGLPDGYRTVSSGFDNCRTNWMTAETDSNDYWETHQVPKYVLAVDGAVDSLEPKEKEVVWWMYGLRRLEPTAAPIVFPVVFRKLRVLVLKRVAIA